MGMKEERIEETNAEDEKRGRDGELVNSLLANIVSSESGAEDKLQFSVSLLNIANLSYGFVESFFKEKKHVGLIDYCLKHGNVVLSYNVFKFINTVSKEHDIVFDLGQTIFDCLLEIVSEMKSNSKSDSFLFKAETFILLTRCSSLDCLNNSPVSFDKLIMACFDAEPVLRSLNTNVYEYFYKSVINFVSFVLEMTEFSSSSCETVFKLFSTYMPVFKGNMEIYLRLTNISLRIIEIGYKGESESFTCEVYDYLTKSTQAYIDELTAFIDSKELFSDMSEGSNFHSLIKNLEIGVILTEVLKKLFFDDLIVLVTGSVGADEIKDFYTRTIRINEMSIQFYIKLIKHAKELGTKELLTKYTHIIDNSLIISLDYIQKESWNSGEYTFLFDFFYCEFKKYCLVIQKFSTEPDCIPFDLIDKCLNLLMFILDSQTNEEEMFILASRFSFAEFINIFHFMYGSYGKTDTILQIMDILAKQTKFLQMNGNSQNILKEIDLVR